MALSYLPVTMFQIALRLMNFRTGDFGPARSRMKPKRLQRMPRKHKMTMLRMIWMVLGSTQSTNTVKKNYKNQMYL